MEFIVLHDGTNTSAVTAFMCNIDRNMKTKFMPSEGKIEVMETFYKGTQTYCGDHRSYWR